LHQVYNLMAAYAVARTLGYRFDAVNTESIAFETAPMRGQTVTSRGVTFIVDCYNANPESVALGLTSLADYPVTGRRIIILGDMLELGDQSVKLHESIGTLLAKEDFDHVALVGPMSKHTAVSARANGVPKKKIAEFDSARDCAQAMLTFLHAGDLVYVKGSRGIGLEVILQSWEQAGGKS
ncbi:MAG TPA: cyanophycin synthetase, partial [Candidatus Acidoferrum sp.]|nr:cyanophycin synthetase [Candidatus Acidoferrum sp.]